MVRIRLRRVGRKKQPSYRIVVADSRSPRDGRYIEVIGFYNPRTLPATMTLKEDRALYWLQVGAQPSDPVRRIMDKLGTFGRLERLNKGESMEALVQEAEAEAEARGEVSPKTQYPSEAYKKARPAAEPAQAAPAPAAEAVEEEEVVAEEEAEAVEAEAEVEAEDEPEAAETE